VEGVEHHGGTIVSNDALINLEIKKTYQRMDLHTMNPNELAIFPAKSRDKALAIATLKRCNKSRYVVLVMNLENQYSIGTDQYSTDLPLELRAVDSYFRTDTTQANQYQHVKTRANEDMDLDFDIIFVQDTNPVLETDNLTQTGITCFVCNGSRHYRNQCPV